MNWIQEMNKKEMSSLWTSFHIVLLTMVQQRKNSQENHEFTLGNDPVSGILKDSHGDDPGLATWEMHVKYKRMSGLEVKQGCE